MSVRPATPALGGVHEAALYPRDLDRAAAFYRRVFGFTEVSVVPGDHVFLRAGRDMLLLFDAQRSREGGRTAPPHGGTGELHVAFDIPVEALEAWRAHLRALDVRIEKEVEWPSGGRSIYVRDPDDNSIELITRETWGF